jgi:hypothetical protein
MFYENEGTEKSLTYFSGTEIRRCKNKEVFFNGRLSFCFNEKMQKIFARGLGEGIRRAIIF